jgi:hypothetical protein
MVILKEPFLGWRSNYEGRLKSSWTGGSEPLLCRRSHNSITAAHCRQSTNFSNGPRVLIGDIKKSEVKCKDRKSNVLCHVLLHLLHASKS